MSSPGYLFLFIVSVLASLFAWNRILRKQDFWPIKLGYLVLATVPVAGPIFYLIIDPPESTPIAVQAELYWTPNRGTKVWPSFGPLINLLHRLLGLLRNKWRRHR
jgi:hypothetical protein